MEKCHFCKDATDDTFKITTPDKEDVFVCEECLNDIFTFFRNGKMEDMKLQGDEKGFEAKLSISESEGRLIEKRDFGVRKFSNFILESANVNRLDRYDINDMSTLGIEKYPLLVDPYPYGYRKGLVADIRGKLILE